MRIQLIVLDPDQDYLERLAPRLMSAYPGRIDVHGFTDAHLALRAAPDVRAHVFLADASFGITADQLPARCSMGWLVDSPAVAAVDGVLAVPRYSRLDELFRHIVQLMDATSGSVELRRHHGGGSTRLVTVSSPAGGVGTSTVALTLARTLAMQAERRRVLYLDLDRCSDTSQITGVVANGGPTFSDVVYAVKRRRGNLQLQLDTLSRPDAYGVHHFPTAVDPADLLDMDDEDVVVLLDALLPSDVFDCVVLDVGFDRLEEIWNHVERSARLVLVTDGRPTPNLKVRRASRILERLDQTHETSVTSRSTVVYNRASASRSQVDPESPLPSVAVVARYEGATEADVLEHIYAAGALGSLVSAVSP
ncbi:hypothetical protein GCM10011331_05970 [Flavimobilis marinus]|uniref:AAA domain-containing protein n=1 Tax=Flavimobilis marinus TaxID=285351 RepID=A0A1I2D4A2_9MICO|nr:hypothetical protein [Flavimobilis marinus]GHG46117.1 hypothetical protein GCM10011331_05970 [Flavimobilis marinus]SFE75324.1 AAA domain-containing protein [Flavimobilis marinus]